MNPQISQSNSQQHLITLCGGVDQQKWMIIHNRNHKYYTVLLIHVNSLINLKLHFISASSIRSITLTNAISLVALTLSLALILSHSLYHTYYY